MTINIEDINDISRYIELSSELNKKILFIPENYENVEEEPIFSSTSTSVIKLLINENIEADYLSDPNAIIEKRCKEWFGPIILITSLYCSQNPHAISLALNLIANYVFQIFGESKDAVASFTILFRDGKKKTTKKIKYKGPSQGIKDLEGTIKHLCEAEQNEN